MAESATQPQTPAEALSYAAPPLAMPVSIPDYSGIVKGASLLSRNATAYRILGWLFIILAAGSIAIAIMTIISRQAPPPDAVIGGGLGLVFQALIAAFLFGRATMIELQAELALATRDIARNSWR